MSRVILIASGKGGTGKTTVAAALACALCDAGRRVLAADLDAGMGNLDIVLGMHDAALFSLAEVLSGAVSAEQAAAPVHGREGLFLLTAPAAGYVPAADRLVAFCAEMHAKDTDVILDCGAGLGDVLSAARSAADLALVVSLPEDASLRNASATAQFLAQRPALTTRLVCNRVPLRRSILRKTRICIDTCMDTAGLPLAAVIPEDEGVRLAAARGHVFYDTSRSPIRKSVKSLAERIISNYF